MRLHDTTCGQESYVDSVYCGGFDTEKEEASEIRSISLPEFQKFMEIDVNS